MGLGLTTAISGGASLISGLLGRSAAKHRDADAKHAFYEGEKRDADQTLQNNAYIAKYNKEQRERADKAAKVPIISDTKERTGGQDVTTHSGYDRTTSSGEDVTSSEVDVDSMMKAAARAGFNPVTWLENGGMQAYARSTTKYGKVEQTDYDSADTTDYGMTSHTYSKTTGTHAMDAALAGNMAPALHSFQGTHPVDTAPGVGEVVGSALTAGAETYVQGLNAQQQHDWAMQLQQAQLSGQLQNAQSLQRSGYVPVRVSAGGVRTASGSAGLSSGGKGATVNVGGLPLTVPKGHASADDCEQWFWEVGGAVCGIANIGDAVGGAARAKFKKVTGKNPENYIPSMDYSIDYLNSFREAAGWTPLKKSGITVKSNKQ